MPKKCKNHPRLTAVKNGLCSKCLLENSEKQAKNFGPIKDLQIVIEGVDAAKIAGLFVILKDSDSLPFREDEIHRLIGKYLVDAIEKSEGGIDA